MCKNDILKTLVEKYNFRTSKNNSLYFTVKKLKNKTVKIRLSNHEKHVMKKNELLFNFVYQSKNDLLYKLRCINKKFNLNIML